MMSKDADSKPAWCVEQFPAKFTTLHLRHATPFWFSQLSSLQLNQPKECHGLPCHGLGKTSHRAVVSVRGMPQVLMLLVCDQVYQVRG
jgi:hypothetical protein